MERVKALALAVAIAAAGCGTIGGGDDAGDVHPVDPGIDRADVEDPPDAELPPTETDVDGDTISDADEGAAGAVDTDGDATADFLDTDSDDDTIPDSEEAGDDDLETPPVDTDSDGVPDFRDTDSDEDGLPDGWEAEMGDCPDPYDDDSDDDGASDLVEVGADTDPCDPSDSPWSDPRVILIPYGEVPVPSLRTYGVSSSLARADVMLAVDSSPSMSGEIANLAARFSDTLAPGARGEIPDVWFGVSRFGDCAGCDVHMAVLQAMTDDVADVGAALGSITDPCGVNVPYLQVLYALVSGNLIPFLGWGGVTPTSVSCTPPGSFGWPCFRQGALPVIVQIGDKSFDAGLSGCSPSPSHGDAIDALNLVGARYVGINSGAARPDMESVANGTGSKDLTSTPLVFNTAADGSGLSGQIVAAIGALATRVLLEVTVVVRDDPADSVDATMFIDSIRPLTTGGEWAPGVPCTEGLAVEDASGDTVADTFTEVLPGTSICFDLTPRRNMTVVADPVEAQVFYADLDVMADGITVLETMWVAFVVPPIPL